jgi:hypothetical protein
MKFDELRAAHEAERARLNAAAEEAEEAVAEAGASSAEESDSGTSGVGLVAASTVGEAVRQAEEKLRKDFKRRTAQVRKKGRGGRREGGRRDEEVERRKKGRGGD